MINNLLLISSVLFFMLRIFIFRPFFLDFGFEKTAAFFRFFRNFKQRGDELQLKIELIKLHNKGFVYFLNCRVSRLFLTEPLNLMCHSVFLKSGEKEVSGVFGPGPVSRFRMT